MFILAGDTVNVCTDDMANILAIVRFALTVIQWVVPIILIVLGSIDLVRAVVAGKDEEIKKHQTTLLKRVIAAVIVFLVPLLVTLIMGFLSTDSWQDCWAGAKDKTISDIINKY